MSTAAKVILGIVVAVALLITVGVALTAGSLMDTASEVQEFAQSGTKQDCLVEGQSRLSQCGASEISCAIGSGVFLTACLEATRGDKATFCASPQARDAERACADAQLCTQVMTQLMDEYCGPRQ